MSTPRRNKALSPDGQTAKFLYCIIKQLNLKSIDWTLVAASLEITNGHAARMRYSRFKQQMEGLISQSSPAKPAKATPKKGKQEKEGYEKPTKGKKRAVEESGSSKTTPKPELYKQPEQVTKPAPTPAVKQEKNENKRIKLEPNSSSTSHNDIVIKKEPDLSVVRASPALAIEPTPPPPLPSYLKPDTSPSSNPSQSPDIWRLLPRTNPYPTLARDPLTSSLTHHQNPFGTPADFTPPPYSTVSLSDLQLSPRTFAPANLASMTPTSPGSLSVVPRMMPTDEEQDAETDGLEEFNLGSGLGLGIDVDMGGLLQGDPDAGAGAGGLREFGDMEGLEDGGWIITGEGKVGGA